MADLVDLGVVQVDPKALVKEIRQDLKDDWFPDSLLHEDRLKGGKVVEAIEENVAKNNGRYMAADSEPHDIPKKGFVLRYSLETPIIDRAYYHVLCRSLLPVYDPLFGERVLSHRMNPKEERGERYIFRHPIEQWRQFEGFARDEAAGNKVVLVTDISNFYENISVEKLQAVLTDKLKLSKVPASDKVRMRATIDELVACLAQWGFDGKKGIPQNRDASSILANVYMMPVDAAMEELGLSYYRYMDDIRVVVDDRYRARRALQDLIGILRKSGLNVNAAKTKILEPGTESYERELGGADLELEQIDQMWKTRSEQVIRRSLGDLKRYTMRLIKERLTQERGFRFAIRRFENLALCNDFELESEYFTEVVEASIQELDEQPYTTDQLVRLLKAAPVDASQLDRVVDFLRDPARSIYDWQNYLLWQLLVYKQYFSDAAIELAMREAADGRGPGRRAGATLLLGASGREEAVELVLSNFERLQGTLEIRAGLIAVHDVAFHKGVKQRVAPFVKAHDFGVYRTLNEGFGGRYHTELEPISFKEMYDEVSQYD